MTLIPAFGRNYRNAGQVKTDFLADKDFVVANAFHPSDGRLINRSQLIEMGETLVNIRYAHLTKVFAIKL